MSETSTEVAELDTHEPDGIGRETCSHEVCGSGEENFWSKWGSK